MVYRVIIFILAKENEAATKVLSEQTRLQIEKEILQEMWKARLVKEQQLIKERKSS